MSLLALIYTLVLSTLALTTIILTGAALFLLPICVYIDISSDERDTWRFLVLWDNTGMELFEDEEILGEGFFEGEGWGERDGEESWEGRG